MNPYKVLGVKPTTDQTAIRKAYIAAIKTHHPDTGGTEESFKIIQDAYQLLTKGYKIPILETSVKLTLNQFMVGGDVTVLLRPKDSEEFIANVNIPAFSYPGDIVEFIDNGLTCRKIRVRLNEDITENYTRLDSSVIIHCQLNKNEAEIGTSVNVDSFDNTTHTIQIPPKTTADRLIYYIGGAGFYKPKSNVRGNLTIIVEIQKKR